MADNDRKRPRPDDEHDEQPMQRVLDEQALQELAAGFLEFLMHLFDHFSIPVPRGPDIGRHAAARVVNEYIAELGRQQQERQRQEQERQRQEQDQQQPKPKRRPQPKTPPESRPQPDTPPQSRRWPANLPPPPMTPISLSPPSPTGASSSFLPAPPTSWTLPAPSLDMEVETSQLSEDGANEGEVENGNEERHRETQ